MNMNQNWYNSQSWYAPLVAEEPELAARPESASPQEPVTEAPDADRKQQKKTNFVLIFPAHLRRFSAQKRRSAQAPRRMI